MRECVAGFLPDVANTFGGIWQACRMRVVRASFTDVAVDANAATLRARVNTHGLIASHARATIELWCDGRRVAETAAAHGQGVALAAGPAVLAQWVPNQANPLTRISLVMRDETGRTLASIARATARRTIDARGHSVLLNGAPLHLRGVLDWGWQPDLQRPTPSVERVRRQIEQARALGFNLIKLCLVVPDATTFETADQLGMPLWLELPLWLPVVTAESRKRILSEYEGILRRVHHHPSIVLVSLGCELDSTVDAALLDALRALVRRWLPNVLLCDNSGSSEAYGGSESATGDFRDYHFYCDPHYFQPLLNAFDRPHQPAQPWIFGEFCDADTLRDFHAIDADAWWLRGPFTMQRDELQWLSQWRDRLSALGVRDGGAALTQLARAQATHTRKTMLEITRKNFAGGGYVVTGWRDTPIATSGIVDDAGALKFDALAWRAFNAERVLLIDRPARRLWTHGGDRPAPLDPSVWWNDEPLDVTVALANGGAPVDAQAALTFEGATRAVRATVPSGAVQQVLRVQLGQPCAGATTLQQRMISAALEEAHNTWPLLFVPRINVAALQRSPRLARALTQDVIERALVGERITVWLEHIDERFCRPCPFVREAIHLIDTTLSSGIDLWPHAFGIASDLAIDVDALANTLSTSAPATVLWKRIDARAMTALAYVARMPVGAGQITVTSLRHAGGHGAQPVGLASTPLGAWLLRALIK